MHWWLLRAHAESESSYDDVVSSLSKQLEDGKASLWQDHKRVSELMTGGAGGSNENSDPQSKSTSDLQSKSTMKGSETEKSAGVSSDILRVEIVGGEYLGTKFEVKPTKSAFAWVGRSTSKKFREKGISLPKDLEVSTTHGRFEPKMGKFVYLDTGSTNGSRIGKRELEPNEKVELRTGMEISVGQTVMRVTVNY